MGVFRRALSDRQPDEGKKKRRWLFVPYDQLSDAVGPLSREDPDELGIVLIENAWKARRRPYHKQKLALILANLRHFALEQAGRGVLVEHMVIDAPYRVGLGEAIKRHGPIRIMRPAERELRIDLQPLFESGQLQEIPHEGWITSEAQFKRSHPGGPPYLLERFYRMVRRDTGVLMRKKQPVGGQFNFDKDNREAYFGEPPAPALPTFQPDEITEEVGELIESGFRHHPGELRLWELPASATHAEQHWQWGKQCCLPNFGRFEDAMSTGASTLFHTRISALLNIGRLAPLRIVMETEALDIPIASKEGFIRQILGWREFMHHVHELTDGFRAMPGAEPPVAESPGDGGYQTWSGHAWPAQASPEDPDGGALLSALGADVPLPPAYWGQPSGLACIDTVVRDVWREGWSHHITRLMILSNFATLFGASPRELTDWFWVAYIDAYDWVVEPNVLGLGTFATGHLFTTKPYVSGANYIRKMSDYCDGCRFVPGKTCPYTPMYWGFLKEHQDLLKENTRLRVLYRTMGLKGEQGQEVTRKVREQLLAGQELTPESIGTAAVPTNDQASLGL